MTAFTSFNEILHSPVEALDLLPDPVLIHIDGRVVYVNPATIKLFNAENSEYLIGKRLVHLFDRKERATIRNSLPNIPENKIIQTSHRIVCMDESIKNIEATSINRRSGNTNFIIAILRDLSERSLSNDRMRQILTAISSHTGHSFYYDLVRSLAAVLDVEYAMVIVPEITPADIQVPVSAVKIIAGWMDGKYVQNDLLDASQGPFQFIHSVRHIEIHNRRIGRAYPDYSFFRNNSIESYIGVPLFNTKGHVTGRLVIMSCRPVMDMEAMASLVQIFALRTSAEIERMHNEEFEKEVQAERSAYLETLALLDEVIVELDETFTLRRVSSSWEKLFGNSFEGSPVGKIFYSITEPDYRFVFEETFQELMDGNKQRAIIRFPVHLPNGAKGWLEGKFIGTCLAGNQKSGIRGVLRDVTLDHLSEKQINFYAYRDNLTGLSNRTSMEEDLQKEMVRSELESPRIGIGFIDLDHFYEINEMLGHKSGDRIISLVAGRLKDISEVKDHLYRWGGDQFVFFTTGISNSSDLHKIGQDLMDAVKKPFSFEGESIHITYSVGITMYPDDAITLEEILGQADRAMTYAKRQGRYTYKIASEIPQKAYKHHYPGLRNQIAAAIQEQQLVAFYQPKVDAISGKIIGVEALARWPKLLGAARIGPDTFIPVAESMGLISELGEQILEQSLQFLAAMKEKDKRLQLAVNVSRRQLLASDYVERLLVLVEKYGIHPSEITLEITESVAMLDVEHAPERLRQLHKAGFLLSIDDFGTGYSTLSQLHEMPVNELKIDMGFVSRINSAEGCRVIQAIIDMGHALDLSIVAEGVETKQAAEKLAQLGVHVLQGFYFGPPRSANEFLEEAKSN